MLKTIMLVTSSTYFRIFSSPTFFNNITLAKPSNKKLIITVRNVVSKWCYKCKKMLYVIRIYYPKGESYYIYDSYMTHILYYLLLIWYTRSILKRGTIMTGLENISHKKTWIAIVKSRSPYWRWPIRVRIRFWRRPRAYYSAYPEKQVKYNQQGIISLNQY